MINEFKDKKIFVTGGTGSIGWVIVKELLKYEPKEIVVYSRDDTKQFECANEIGKDAPVRFVIGDVRDKNRLHEAMHGNNIVFHAAAVKHVSACENNPIEAVQTNVLGTQNVIDCSFANNIEKVVGISTDKAANATNVLGSTKFLSEKLMRATKLYRGPNKTKFCFVRFGNVLDSRGSVVPLFYKQVRDGGPITITDPDMSRFFMSIPQAVELIFKATQMMRDREIFILKMPVVKVRDIATAVIDCVGELTGKSVVVDIKIIGKRDGERMHEILLSQDESMAALETDEMFILMPDSERNESVLNLYPGARLSHVGAYRSNDQISLTIVQIKDLLKPIIALYSHEK